MCNALELPACSANGLSKPTLNARFPGHLVSLMALKCQMNLRKTRAYGPPRYFCPAVFARDTGRWRTMTKRRWRTFPAPTDISFATNFNRRTCQVEHWAHCSRDVSLLVIFCFSSQLQQNKCKPSDWRKNNVCRITLLKLHVRCDYVY